LNDGSLVVPFLHGNFAAGADDLEYGFTFDSHGFGGGEQVQTKIGTVAAGVETGTVNAMTFRYAL